MAAISKAPRNLPACGERPLSPRPPRNPIRTRKASGRASANGSAPNESRNRRRSFESLKSRRSVEWLLKTAPILRRDSTEGADGGEAKRPSIDAAATAGGRRRIGGGFHARRHPRALHQPRQRAAAYYSRHSVRRC